jgi:transcriptional regulator with GAF, ATPase, and Fis domain
MSSVSNLVLDIQQAWAAPKQPEAVLDAVGRALSQTVGYRLYTVTQMLKGGREVERIHSTNQDVYPVGGRKPVLPNAYSERVRTQMQPFLGRTVADFAPYFPDHETIAGLGLGSVINLPIVYAGAVLGTVNILDREYAYDTQHVEPAMTIARQLLPALLTIES